MLLNSASNGFNFLAHPFHFILSFYSKSYSLIVSYSIFSVQGLIKIKSYSNNNTILQLL